MHNKTKSPRDINEGGEKNIGKMAELLCKQVIIIIPKAIMSRIEQFAKRGLTNEISLFMYFLI